MITSSLLLTIIPILVGIVIDAKKNGKEKREKGFSTEDFKTCVSGFCLPKVILQNIVIQLIVDSHSCVQKYNSLDLPNKSSITNIGLEMEVLDILKVNLMKNRPNKIGSSFVK